MSKRYRGFYCYREPKKGIFGKEKYMVGPLRVEADSFAEAQQRLCDAMPKRGIEVALIFPYVESLDCGSDLEPEEEK